MWLELRRHAVHGWKFKRQKPIERYIVDFCCSSARVVVELDGGVHDTPDAQIYDALRNAKLQLGYAVLRFRNADVFNNLPAVLKEIAAYLPQPSPDSR